LAKVPGFDFTIPEGEFKFYSGMKKKVVIFKIQGVDVVVPEPPKDIKNKLDNNPYIKSDYLFLNNEDSTHELKRHEKTQNILQLSLEIFDNIKNTNLNIIQ
jgi:hypothetical protein